MTTEQRILELEIAVKILIKRVAELENQQIMMRACA